MKHKINIARIIAAAVMGSLIIFVAGTSIVKANNDDLINATRNNTVQEVKRLLNEGADVNARNQDGWTSLMMAALGGHLEVAKLLIDKGADVNAKNNAQGTALMVASW